MLKCLLLGVLISWGDIILKLIMIIINEWVFNFIIKDDKVEEVKWFFLIGKWDCFLDLFDFKVCVRNYYVLNRDKYIF